MLLKNDRLMIRTIEKSDLKEFWNLAYGGDLEWMKWNGPYFDDPIHEEDEFVHEIGPKYYVNNPNRGVIVVDGTIVGVISAYFYDSDLQRWLEFGLIIFNKNDWNKGYGTQASKLWVEYLFNSYSHFPHVGFTTWSGNQGMMHLGEKLGMKLEARIRKVRYYNEKYWDSIKYGVLRDEWIKS